VTSGSSADAFDPDALRTKYAEERQRRLRSDGISQYVEITGAFSKFGEDPGPTQTSAATPSPILWTSRSSAPASAACWLARGASSSASRMCG